MFLQRLTPFLSMLYKTEDKPVDYYLNFNLIGSTIAPSAQRFHVLLPWANLNIKSFDEFDNHLRSLMPESIWLHTRKLKPSKHLPEANSIEFAAWYRLVKAMK